MTEEQAERLIAALERLASAHEQQLQARQRVEERLATMGPVGPGPMPSPAVAATDTPPEMMRMIEALEGIASGLNARSNGN